MNPETKSNVVQLKPNYAIFNPTLRKKISSGIEPLTEKPDEVVTRTEQIISVHLVESVRGAANRFGRWLGEKICNV